MPRNSLCLKIPKINGEKAITTTNKLDVIDKELEIQRNSTHLYIPITRNLLQEELKMLKKLIPNLEFSTRTFQERKKHPTTLLEVLKGKLPQHLLSSLPRAIDFVGDIAIIEIPKELEAYKTEIGNALVLSHKNLRTVLAKAGPVKGKYRLREFTHIAGENRTETIHKENRCKYYVDLARVYFSPRLSNEHKRVASAVKEGETIIDMFAGVGPFAILIAKTHENVKIYAIDINPDAIAFLEKNVRLNRVEGKVHPLLGDAKQIVRQHLCGMADRVIMNLPEKSMEFISAACEALKPEGGIMHFYSFVNLSDSLENLKIRFEKEIEKFGRKVEKILFMKPIRETAPYEWQVVLDAEIC